VQRVGVLKSEGNTKVLTQELVYHLESFNDIIDFSINFASDELLHYPYTVANLFWGQFKSLIWLSDILEILIH
jgi:hypothetical protein